MEEFVHQRKVSHQELDAQHAGGAEPDAWIGEQADFPGWQRQTSTGEQVTHFNDDDRVDGDGSTGFIG